MAHQEGDFMDRGDRVIYLDILRIISIFAVIMLHVAAVGFLDKNTIPRSLEWQVYAIYDAIVRFATPVFIMITGALYGDCSKRLDLRGVYKKNILRLFCALMFWCFVFAKLHVGFSHLWYLFMCISLYMLLPFLRKITESRELTKYFLLLSVCFTFLIPQLIDTMLVLYKGTGVLRSWLLWVQSGFFGSWYYHLGFGCYSYFVIGYVLSVEPMTDVFRKRMILAGTVGFLYTILGTSILSWTRDMKCEVFYNSLSLNVLAEASFVFVFIKYIASQVKFGTKSIRILKEISDSVFGIYLIHPLVQRVLSSVIRPLEFNPVWMSLVMVLMIFCVSCVASIVLRKIYFLRGYII